MSCRILGTTAEELRNLVSNRKVWFKVGDNQTREDTISFLQATTENVSDPNDNNRYQVAQREIAKRPSDKTQAAFKRKVEARGGTIEQYDTENNRKKRDLGTKLHAVMQNYINYLYNNVGTEAEVRRLGKEGPFSLTEEQLNQAKKASQNIIKQIEAIQDEINKQNETEEKASIFVEQKLIDPIEDTAGTIDLLAVFSDNTAAIYDYKTIHTYNYSKLSKNILTEPKIEDYHLPMSTYKDILLSRYGVKSIRQSRLMPIRTVLKRKSKNEQAPGDILTNKVQLLEFFDENSFLKQVPVAQENTKYKGLNKLLEKQSTLIKNLEAKLTKGGISIDERAAIKNRIYTLKQLVRKTIVDLEVQGIRADVANTLNFYSILKKESDILEDGEVNPNGPTIENLTTVIDELSVYNELIENLKEYLTDLADVTPDEYNKLFPAISSLSGGIAYTIEDAKEQREQRILSLIPEKAKDEQGRLLSYEGLSPLERMFLQSNEIDHPIFKALFHLKDEAEYDTRQDYKEFAEEFEAKLEPLYNWAKANGYTRHSVFNLFINDAGNIHSKFSEKYYALRKNAASDGDVAFMKKYFIPKRDDLEAYIKERREKYSNYLKATLNDLKPIKDSATGETIRGAGSLKTQYDNSMKEWEQNNNILKYDTAWLNLESYGPHRTMLTLNPKLESEFYSEEYKKISQTKELLDFYEYHTDKMYEFRDMLHVLGDTPSNFVANVRKTMIDQFLDSKSLLRPFKELRESLSIRSDDEYIANVDPNTNEIQRSIPKLFIRPLENKDDKSRDLAKNLFLFGRMAYNYKYLSNIEAQVLALKELLGDPSNTQGGERVLGFGSSNLKGEIVDFFDRAKRDTKTYQHFSDFVDYFLYSIKFKEKNLFGPNSKIDSTKTLLALKNYFSMKSLAFAVIPGTGALIAGKIATIVEGKKGDSFTTEQFRAAQARQIQMDKLSRSMAQHFDTYSEDPADRIATKLNTRVLNKMFASRNLFGPLRKADETLNDVVLDAMSENYGVNEAGEFVRINRKGANIKGVKSIRELSKIDDKGKFTIELSKENTLKFRNAVKATMSNIIGNMSNEEIAMYDLNLLMSIAMQFKTWMPGLVRERFGKLRYDEHIQAVRQGRYNSYFSGYKPTAEELQNGFVIGYYVKNILIPNMTKTAFDIATFGLAPKLGISRIDESRARAHFEAWKIKMEKRNPELANQVSFEEYLEAKQHQIKAFIVELRVILMALSFFTIMGADDEHGDPRYMNNYLTRTLYKMLRKGNSELTFMWNPNEFARLIANPLPMSRLLTDLSKTISNTIDESRDLTFGENSPQDRSPLFYYTSQWAIGGSQIARLAELFDQYKQPAY